MEKVKKNVVMIMLVINLALGVLTTGGVTYLIMAQHNGPEKGEQMGDNGMVPPQMNQDQQQNTPSGNSSNTQ